MRLPSECLSSLRGGDEDCTGESWNDVHALEHPDGLVIEWDCVAATRYGLGGGSGAEAKAISAGSHGASADDPGFAAAQLPFQPVLLSVGDDTRRSQVWCRDPSRSLCL